MAFVDIAYLKKSHIKNEYIGNIDLPIISRALGHALPQTTLIYIKDINDVALEIANHRIIKQILQQ